MQWHCAARSDVVRDEQLRDGDTLADTSDVVPDEVAHHQELYELHGHDPVAHELLDGVVRVRQLAKGGGPEDEGHELGQRLRCQEVGRVLLRLALLHEHEELRQHGHGLEVEGERPGNVRGEEVVQVRVQDQRNDGARGDDPEVVEVVGRGLVGVRVLHADAVHDGAREAEAERLAHLVHPVAGLVEGQVTLERDDGAEAAEEDDDVALHHLQRDALHTLASLDHHRDHEEAEHAHEGGQGQQEGEIAAGEHPEDDDSEGGEAAPELGAR
mmetsp:Transcript_74942/g.219367  ORF Transcript_74942/g.219367 Transcript_74942/m.219367 type:complete len:270 (+) Transcript_74942:13-822(+)